MEKPAAVAAAAGAKLPDPDAARAEPRAMVSVPVAPGAMVSIPATAGGGRVKLSRYYSSSDEEGYIPPADPFDTRTVDDAPEAEDEDVVSDLEDYHVKTRHVFRRLEAGTLNWWFCPRGLERPVYRCPFCTRGLADRNFSTVCAHATSLGSFHGHIKVGPSVNEHAFKANHMAYALHLQRLRDRAILLGTVDPPPAPKTKPPKVKGLGSRRERRRQRLEAERWA